MVDNKLGAQHQYTDASVHGRNSFIGPVSPSAQGAVNQAQNFKAKGLRSHTTANDSRRYIIQKSSPGPDNMITEDSLNGGASLQEDSIFQTKTSEQGPNDSKLIFKRAKNYAMRQISHDYGKGPIRKSVDDRGGIKGILSESQGDALDQQFSEQIDIFTPGQGSPYATKKGKKIKLSAAQRQRIKLGTQNPWNVYHTYFTNNQQERNKKIEEKLKPWERSYMAQLMREENLRSSQQVGSLQQFKLETIDVKDMRARHSINFKTIFEQANNEKVTTAHGPPGMVRGDSSFYDRNTTSYHDSKDECSNGIQTHRVLSGMSGNVIRNGMLQTVDCPNGFSRRNPDSTKQRAFLPPATRFRQLGTNNNQMSDTQQSFNNQSGRTSNDASKCENKISFNPSLDTVADDEREELHNIILKSSWGNSQITEVPNRQQATATTSNNNDKVMSAGGQLAQMSCITSAGTDRYSVENNNEQINIMQPSRQLETIDSQAEDFERPQPSAGSSTRQKSRTQNASDTKSTKSRKQSDHKQSEKEQSNTKLTSHQQSQKSQAFPPKKQEETVNYSQNESQKGSQKSKKANSVVQNDQMKNDLQSEEDTDKSSNSLVKIDSEIIRRAEMQGVRDSPGRGDETGESNIDQRSQIIDDGPTPPNRSKHGNNKRRSSNNDSQSKNQQNDDANDDSEYTVSNDYSNFGSEANVEKTTVKKSKDPRATRKEEYTEFEDDDYMNDSFNNDDQQKISNEESQKRHSQSQKTQQIDDDDIVVVSNDEQLDQIENKQQEMASYNQSNKQLAVCMEMTSETSQQPIQKLKSQIIHKELKEAQTQTIELVKDDIIEEIKEENQQKEETVPKALYQELQNELQLNQQKLQEQLQKETVPQAQYDELEQKMEFYKKNFMMMKEKFDKFKTTNQQLKNAFKFVQKPSTQSVSFALKQEPTNGSLYSQSYEQDYSSIMSQPEQKSEILQSQLNSSQPTVINDRQNEHVKDENPEKLQKQMSDVQRIMTIQHQKETKNIQSEASNDINELKPNISASQPQILSPERQQMTTNTVYAADSQKIIENTANLGKSQIDIDSKAETQNMHPATYNKKRATEGLKQTNTFMLVNETYSSIGDGLTQKNIYQKDEPVMMLISHSNQSFAEDSQTQLDIKEQGNFDQQSSISRGVDAQESSYLRSVTEKTTKAQKQTTQIVQNTPGINLVEDANKIN